MKIMAFIHEDTAFMSTSCVTVMSQADYHSIPTHAEMQVSGNECIHFMSFTFSVS